jgi:hypothetical protein
MGSLPQNNISLFLLRSFAVASSSLIRPFAVRRSAVVVSGISGNHRVQHELTSGELIELYHNL